MRTALHSVPVRSLISTPLPRQWRQGLAGALMIFYCAMANRLLSADTNDVATQLRKLQEQNRALREQLREQSEALKRLTGRLNEMERARAQPQADLPEAATSDRSAQPGLLDRGLS